MLKFQDDYITKNENMEDLFTIILTIVDDLYQTYAPEEIRNRKNISEAKCSDAEIITISIVGEMMGVDSETAWHSFVKKNYSHLFPHLCCRSRYHRRKKNLYLLTELLRAKLEKEMDVGLCGNYIADSYPLPVCKFGRAYFCKSFRYEGAAYILYHSCPIFFKKRFVLIRKFYLDSTQLLPGSFSQSSFLIFV